MNHFTRRGVLAVLVAWPAMAFAHGDHDKARFHADSKVLKIEGRAVRVELSVLNLASNAMALKAMSSEGAEILSFTAPSEISGFGTAKVMVEMEFRDVVPEVFTIVLDFGTHGHGAVLVAP